MAAGACCMAAWPRRAARMLHGRLAWARAACPLAGACCVAWPPGTDRRRGFHFQGAIGGGCSFLSRERSRGLGGIGGIRKVGPGESIGKKNEGQYGYYGKIHVFRIIK